MMISLDLRY